MSEKEHQEISLEEMFHQLDEMIEQMEQDQLPLDQAFAMYESGLKKLKQCNEKLDIIEKKMLELNQNGETVPFQ
ncbi:exodeoxyribonuclease VII small subunit [uncultured Roseburia sp.]|uniref:Exodeoxyribonuclease 7 small subunit n=1 Tax=Brotonthovivens ammoniilytica TaxID=2981725 RepID=A0ABT2TFP4_9FIRM|nr:exodeoxyribonuclease VII small subunit [Brotonthovivens ammoniilytica]MCU6761002.1 exodeoxyribonuclease VII small subunit [Brotonthovivens ammoniilytica]SCI15977.1 exodeoxyribonuclease VII small subunit [uncultured Roseburia sp.]